MTLVEVVAGIALLSTLLVMTLMSYRSHATQIRSAKDRMKAIRAADELLSLWMASSSLPRVGQQEGLSGTPGWYWRIMPVEPSQDLTVMGAASVRLEIVDTNGTTGERMLARVELLVPVQGGSVR